MILSKGYKLTLILLIVTAVVVGLYLFQKQVSKEEPVLSIVSEKRDFKVDEDTEFKFKYLKAQVASAESIKEDSTDYWEDIDIDAEIKDPTGEKIHTSPEISLEDNGEFSVKLEKPSMLKPGVYTMKLKVEDESGNSTRVKEIEQEFTWGVLAINTNKSIYLPHETAYLQMAVLREDGHTICDANLELRIENNELGINELLSTEDGTIQYSGECGADNVTNVPDYFVYYQVEEIGKYEMRLKNLDTGYEITDYFEVREFVPFEIERIGPTRIYPLADYEMTLKIKANQDFEGQVIEIVSERFEILNRESASITSEGGTKIISWQAAWKSGETHELSYTFDAPNIAPYLYLLGPLTMRQSNNETIFSEQRQWQIASDAPDFPTVAATNYSVEASETGSHTVNLPAGIQSGDLLLVYFVSDDNENVTFPNEGVDWFNIYEEDGGNSGPTLAIAYRMADGSEDPTITVTTGDTEQSVHISHRITAWDSGQAPEVSVEASGADVYPNPASLTPTGGAKDYLWIAVAGSDDGKDLYTAYPTNYTDNQETYQSAESNGGCNIGVATRNYNNSSDDPGTFTIENSEQWDAATVVVHPISAITVSGTVYTNEGVSGMDSGRTVRLKVNGQGTYSNDTDGSGNYSITGITPPSADDVFTVFLDGASEKAITITKASSTSDNITGLNLYQNRVIVRHEDAPADPITIADMAYYDNNDDSDIQFTATTTEGIATTTTIFSGNKLYIWPGKTFNASGTITILGNGAGEPDGSLHITTGATLTACPLADCPAGGDITLAGSWIASSTATFTHNNATTTFTATSTGKNIWTEGNSDFYNMVFNGSGGEWTFKTNSATTTNDFTITQGTVTSTSEMLYVGGSWQVGSSGTFLHNNATIVFDSADTGETINPGSSSFYNVDFNNSGGGWTFNSDATTTNNFFITQGAVTAYTGYLDVGNNFSNAGTFTHGSGIVRFYATDSGNTITPGSSDFYDLYFDGSSGSWTFTSNSATVTNDFYVYQGTITSPSEILYVGGSWLVGASGTFTHNNSTTTFDSADTGETIDPGESSFYNVDFDNAGGGWRITNDATSTNNWFLTNAEASDGFIVDSNVRIEVKKQFSNQLPGTETTWNSGSLLYLNSETNYTVNSKTVGDVYETLQIGVNTDIKIWNSTSSTYTVDSSASLYSMDHDRNGSGAGDNGYLYIWGDYHTTSGNTDYWSYEMDFDGTAGVNRQVNVLLAANSSSTLDSGGILNATGTASASTTIDRQSSGNYGLKVEGGTLNMEYYQIRNANENGLWLTGSPTITSLDYGDYGLSVEGGTMMTVEAAVIDANNELTITGSEFSTTSDLSVAYNVTEIGTPSSYWTFGGHYGNLDGEDYDNDPGDPQGYIRWDDSPYTTFKQWYYRWYENINQIDPVNPLFATNTEATNATSGTVFRLRVNIQIGSLQLDAGNSAFILQYASATDCSFVSEQDWTEIGGLAADYTSVWRGYDNGAPDDGDTITSFLLVGKSDVFESYEETSPSVNNPNVIPAGQAGEWDWSLQYNAAYSSRTYCFRMAKANGNPFDTYTNYPKIVTYQAATWKAVEDADGSVAIGTDIRLRFQLINTGDATATDYKYQIEYAARTGGTCGDETFIPMPILNTSSTALFEMTTSTFFRYQDPTTHQLSPTSTYPFNTGQLVETYATTGDMDIGDFSLSETEYVFHISTTTPEGYYCFRLTNDGIALDSYNVYGVLYVGTVGVNLSGTIYPNEGGTSHDCAVTPLTVTAKVNGVGEGYETTCDQSNGTYSIETLTASAGDVITVYLNTGGAEQAVAVTKAIDGNTSISGLDLYENRVILRSDNGVALTIENMAQYDNSDDPDIQFTATTTEGTATTTTIFSGNKLYIWPSQTFTPGGTVIVLGNAAGSPDGDLHIADGATFNASTTTQVSGSWIASSSATFTHNDGTVTFKATATDKIIWIEGSSDFYNLTFNGSGGGWTFWKGTDTTTTNNFTITQGTVTSTDGTLAVGNNFANSGGTFNATTGTVLFNATDEGNTINPGNSTFYNLNFDGSGGGWEFTSNSATATNNFWVTQGTATSASDFLYVGGSWLVGSSGTFLHNSATTTFDSTDGGETIDPGESSFYNVDFDNSGGGWTFTSDATTTNNFFITQGAVTAYTGYLDVGNSFLNSGTFNNNSGIVRFYATDSGNTITPGGADFYDLYFDGSGGSWTFTSNSATATNDFTANQGTITSPSDILYVGGSWLVGASGTFIHNSATTTFDSTDGGETIDPDDSSFYNVDFDNSGGGWEFTSDATTTNNFFITQGAVTAYTGYLDIGNNFLNSGTFTHNDGTVRFYATDEGHTINQGGSSFGTTTFDGSGGGWEFITNSATTTGNFNIYQGTATSASEILYVGGSWYNAGTFRHNNATTTFDSTDGGETIDPGESSFYNVDFDNSGGGWTFTSDATTTNNFFISQGAVTAPSGYLDVGNSFSNSGTFTHNSGIVRFYATDSGNQITTNESDFYQLLFDGTDGGWTFQDHATSTATTTITKGTLIQGTNIDLTLGGLYIETGTAAFTKDADTGVLYFERTADGDPSVINDVQEDNNLGDVYIGYSPGVTNQNSDIIVDSFTVNVGDTHNTRGYEIDCASFITIYGTLNAADDKEGDLTNIFLQTNWTNTGTFTHGDSTTTFDGATENNTIAPGGSDFYSIVFDGTGGWEFTSNSATATHDFFILQGTATSASEMLYVGGSWQVGSSGTFLHNNATTTFNSADTGETINPGLSSFYNVDFDNSTGGWTITNDATSTNNWFLTNAATSDGFIVDSNVRIEVKKQFSNQLPGTETTWNSGSLLYLNSETNYTVNSKTVGDVYETLQIGVNTDIRMWNSTSSTYTVDSSGSLYSMDHDRDGNGTGNNGYLYIWGDYHIPAGTTDYWTYESDFDGTAAANRQVNVRLAANSTTTFDAGETLHATGTASASTTIDRQSSGNYAIKVEGGILNMEYYEIRNANENGLWLTGSPTITSLNYGDYGLSVEGGTTMTVEAEVIDANNPLTIQGCEFSTTSDLNTAYNVTEIGTPSFYWTFAGHYGNLDGEDYDNDPGDPPGYIRWDDSGITVSGIIYTNEGITAFNCVGDNLIVKIELNGAGDYTDTCTTGDGSYSMVIPIGAANDVLTVFVDGHGSFRAVTITKASSSDDNITGLDLYQNRVIVKHEDAPADPITIADMAYYDADDDTDIKFTATTTDGIATTTTIFAGNKLYIWSQKTFNASGSIAILGNAGGEPDGSLHIAEGATLTACPASDCSAGNGITLAGSWIASSSATFTHNDVTVTFEATTTGKNIWTEGSSDFYDITFNGSGGEWTFKTNSATTTNDFTITQGTVTSTSGILYVGGDWSNSGTFDHKSGTVFFNATDENHTIDDGGSAFYLIDFDGTGGTWLYQDGTSVSPATTTVQNGTSTFLNAKTGGVKVTGGYLLVDWYLGAHLIDASNTAINIDTDDCYDITISEGSASSTIWGYIEGTGWDGPYNSTTTGTGLACGGDSGINPQPGTTSAIRIREYKKTATETFYYKYNLQVEWQTNYGEYDYYDDYGNNYLTSASSTQSSGVDKVITETWHRTSSSTINSPYTCSAGSGNQCINQPPDNGSWYVGMRPGLLFEIVSGLSVDFGELNSSNNWTGKASSTLEVTTSASNGYVVTAWAINEAKMKLGSFDIYIPKYNTKNDFPKEWDDDEYCYIYPNCCGFGFTTDDSNLSGGTADRFTSGSGTTCGEAGASGNEAYSGFATSTETVAFNPVADFSSPTTTDRTIITYKISVDSAQAAGNYQTTVIYICTANY